MASDRGWNEVIRDEINERMCNRFDHNVDFSFITPEQLNTVWKESAQCFQHMQDVTGLNFDRSDLQFVNHIKVISILVMIDFRPWRLVAAIIAGGFSDADLPFQFDDLCSRWFDSIKNKKHVAGNFVNQQYAFCPIIIEKGRDLKRHDRRLRLPIVNEELVGEGSFGAVFKVRIAKGCFKKRTRNGYSYNAEELVVARKRFRSAWQGEIEQDALARLRRDGWKNDCIISSLASVSLGDSIPSSPECEYNLFFDYAPTDLFRFLRGNAKSYAELDIRPEDITPQALFRELFNLIDAIRYLHREDLRMCHSDLKPDNVLIFLPEVPEDHPVGQWKLTDFGVASIEPRPPREAQSVRDVIKSAARLSMVSEGSKTNTDGSIGFSIDDPRRPGQFHPPELEDLESIAEERYRTKGDVWSLGCIAAYVFVFALGGSHRIRDLQDTLHTTAREGIGRGGFFYESRPDGSWGLYSGLVEFMEILSTRWEAWAQENLPGNTWVQDVWDKLIKPMLNVSVRGRTTAQALWDAKDKIQRQIPSTNIWEAFQSRVVIQSQPLQSTTQHQMIGSLTSSSDSKSTASHASTARLQLTQPKSARVSIVESSTPLRPTLDVVDQTIPEDAEAVSGTISSRPTAFPSADTSMTMPQPFMPIKPLYDDIRRYIDKCNAVKVSQDGLRVVAMTRTKIVSLVMNRHFPPHWIPEDDMERTTQQKWTSLSFSGPYLLLRNKEVSRMSHTQMYLHKFGSTTTSHRQEWNDSIITNLSSVCHVTVSSVGYVAFRFITTKALAVYDHRAHMVFEWNLETFKMPLTANERRKSSEFDCGNFEVMAFAPNGRHLVATAWNSWFLWDLALLHSDGYPSRFGRHSYTPYETGHSKCSLSVLNGGRYFLLHDQCHGKHYVCIDTSKSDACYKLQFASRPKPETIVVSPSCDWMAYLVENSWGKDYLHYCQLQHCTPESNSTPTFGPDQTYSLSKIRTEKRDHQSVIDAALNIVYWNDEPFVVISSISGYIEVIPLQKGVGWGTNRAERK